MHRGKYSYRGRRCRAFLVLLTGNKLTVSLTTFVAIEIAAGNNFTLKLCFEIVYKLYKNV